MSEADWLRKRATLSPEREAAVCGETRVTYAELDARVDGIAGGLAGSGVEPGERVAVLMRNGLPFVELVHAVPRAGAILVPLNVRLAIPEVEWQVRDCSARLVVCDIENAAKASEVAGAAEVLTIAELRARPTGAVREARFEMERVHSIVYTSGTTGRPKGATLTFGNHFWNAIGSALNLGVLPSDRWLACMPLFHVGGLAILLRAVLYGNSAIVHESFDPERVNADIDRERVSTASLVSLAPEMLRRVLDARGDRPFPESLRVILLGGAPSPVGLLERCAAIGAPVAPTYGLTEAASQVATLRPDELRDRIGSAGKPLWPVELRIDCDGREAEPGEAGDIVLRGPTVSPGYWGGTPRTDDEWFRTGDVASLDSDGFLHVLDRRDDLIVSGGENVYPAEVEAVLLSHPAVLDAAVYGAPDERWGQTPVADVRLREGATLSEGELVAWCRGRLAAYKVPVRIRFVESLSRNASGKLVRRVARDEAQR